MDKKPQLPVMVQGFGSEAGNGMMAALQLEIELGLQPSVSHAIDWSGYGRTTPPKVITEQPEVPVRVVVCAANRFGDHVVLGARHFDARMRAGIAALNCERSTEPWRQGFIDQWGVFMDRYEALAVATAAGQINVRRPKTNPLNMLFSEDLY